MEMNLMQDSVRNRWTCQLKRLGKCNVEEKKKTWNDQETNKRNLNSPVIKVQKIKNNELASFAKLTKVKITNQQIGSGKWVFFYCRGDVNAGLICNIPEVQFGNAHEKPLN